MAKVSGALVPPRRSINAIPKLVKAHLQDVEANHLRRARSLIGRSGATAPPRVEEGNRNVCGASKPRLSSVESHATKPSVRPFHVAQILADSGERSSIACGAIGATGVLATSVVAR